LQFGFKGGNKMKSLDALYEEVQGSDELKKEFVTAYKV